MKKKLLISLFIVLSLFIVTGCNKKEENKSTKKDEEHVKIEDNDIKFSLKSNFKELFYTESARDFTSNSYGNVLDLTIRSDGGPVLAYMRMVYFEGKTFDELKVDVESEITDKKIGDITYHYYETEDVPAEGLGDDCTAHTYSYEFDGATYVISFISNKDIKDFEKTFMNYVYFKKN